MRPDATWSRALLALGGWSAAALLLGALAGAVAGLAALAAGLFLLALTHYRHIAALRLWARQGVAQAVPRGRGVWDRTYAELYRWLRRHERTEARLRAELEEFRRAGAAMPDGVVILDEEDRIEWCNPMAEAHLGLERARDTGQAVTFIVRQPQFVDYLRSGSYREPLVLRHARGGPRTLALELVPYGERRKLLISRDVTDLERVEAMRRDFVANVSHELRTPLTVLAGFLETLAEAGAAHPELWGRSLPPMLEQARRMRRLVEDLLMLSQLESADHPLREEPVDVPQLVQAVHRDALALSAGRHRVRLELASADWLAGSAEELRSAFGNLASNAVRYTPQGGEVTIAWRREGAGAAFSVRDTGIGIAPQHIPRLTERFYRVDRARSRETGGTGLGLAIVKHVLARHQARLEIASEPGRGSTFTAVFPGERLLARAPEQAELKGT